MKTRLTEMLDIEHPIMLAGMGGVSYHALVAAVSEAGGIGTLGASTMGEGVLAQEIEGVKKLTKMRAPEAMIRSTSRSSVWGSAVNKSTPKGFFVSFFTPSISWAST
ncbi:MAG: hypothetical protein EBZ55_07080, partial [Actinobacteria bacterium]|nr:hypothetical protein [Actinomycetota bacterium]